MLHLLYSRSDRACAGGTRGFVLRDRRAVTGVRSAEHPIRSLVLANFVVFRSLASARRARPRAPSPARLRCVSCEGRGAQQGGALSVWVVRKGEHKGVAACECRHGNAVIIMVCGHAKSFMQGACRAAVSWADSRVAHCVRRASSSTWLPLLVTSCVREDAHVTEAQRGHPRHAQVHRHDSICDHVPWDPYYP